MTTSASPRIPIFHIVWRMMLFSSRVCKQKQFAYNDGGKGVCTVSHLGINEVNLRYMYEEL